MAADDGLIIPPAVYPVKKKKNKEQEEA